MNDLEWLKATFPEEFRFYSCICEDGEVLSIALNPQWSMSDVKESIEHANGVRIVSMLET